MVSCCIAKGLRAWVWQRVSAVVLAVYGLILFGFWVGHDALSWDAWHALLFCPIMRLLGGLAVLSLLVHAWIGFYTVLTDYVKCFVIQKSLLACVVFSSLVYAVWAGNCFVSVSNGENRVGAAQPSTQIARPSGIHEHAKHLVTMSSPQKAQLKREGESL